MIDPLNMEAAFKEIVDLHRLDQEPHRVRQVTHWDIKRKSSLLELNLGPGYYAHCDLKP